MADNTTPTKPKKIIDIAHPGDSAPSPNSKSVIITNRPTMRDPMMNSDSSVTETTENPETTQSATASAAPATHASHGVIQPLESSPKPVVQETAAIPEPAVIEADDSNDQPNTDSAEPVATVQTALAPGPEPSAEQQPAPQPAMTPKPSIEPESPKMTSTGTDAKVGTKDIQTEVNEASAEDAEAERQANLQKLVDNKTYYLPINTLESQRTKQFVAIGTVLSLLLVVAWADIALDAGLVHIGNLKAVTHFFN